MSHMAPEAGADFDYVPQGRLGPGSLDAGLQGSNGLCRISGSLSSGLLPLWNNPLDFSLLILETTNIQPKIQKP